MPWDVHIYVMKLFVQPPQGVYIPHNGKSQWPLENEYSFISGTTDFFKKNFLIRNAIETSQQTFTCSKSRIELLEEGRRRFLSYCYLFLYFTVFRQKSE